MSIHLPLTIVFAVGSALALTGCEQRYVGGPVVIVEGTAPEHGMLGMSFSAPSKTLTVSSVLTDGPAFRSGVKMGDEIVALDQEPVSSPDEVLSIIRSTQPGDGIVVRARRSGEEVDFEVILCDFARLVALKRLEDSRQSSGQ